MTIAELLMNFLKQKEAFLCKGGIFTVDDMLLLAGASGGHIDNFVIFNNAGGKPFDIWHWENDPEKTSKLVASLIEGRSKIYAYNIAGVETILVDEISQY